MAGNRNKRLVGSSDSPNNILIAVAWFRPDQWARLREVSVDAENLETSHEEWVMGAERLLRRLRKELRKSDGISVRRVLVDVDELVSWCEDQGRKVDAEARATFASEKSQREYEAQ